MSGHGWMRLDETGLRMQEIYSYSLSILAAVVC